MELGLQYQLIDSSKLWAMYHQKTIWDINNSSSPILDTDYNPSLVYEIRNENGLKLTWGIFEHLSNGKSGEHSRGLNMSYLSAQKFFFIRKSQLILQGKLFVSYQKDDGSPDITDYQGIWNSSIRWNNFIPTLKQEHFFYFELSPGGVDGMNFANGNIILELGLKPTSSTHFHIFTQYFSGRNEYLLDYKTYHQAIRAGLLFE